MFKLYEITKNGKGTALYFQDKRDALMFCLGKMARIGNILQFDGIRTHWDVQEVQHGA